MELPTTHVVGTNVLQQSGSDSRWGGTSRGRGYKISENKDPVSMETSLGLSYLETSEALHKFGQTKAKQQTMLTTVISI